MHFSTIWKKKQFPNLISELPQYVHRNKKSLRLNFLAAGKMVTFLQLFAARKLFSPSYFVTALVAS